MPLPWLDAETVAFPPPETALEEPDGLLAAGGALTPEWLLSAYSQGIFPWYESGQPILWWSPDPRMVLFPERLRISRSLRKLLNNCPYTVTFDSQFARVIERCAAARTGSAGTWITPEMMTAYRDLKTLGFAHSVEVWDSSELVGGLYGVALGRVFFGESMFSAKDNASKVALAYLVRHLRHWGYELIDCQVSSEHLKSLGAEPISRKEFLKKLQSLLSGDSTTGNWQMEEALAVLP